MENKEITIKEGAIYMFTNLVNGKKYVGQTTRVYGRHSRYFYHINKSKHPNTIKNTQSIDYAIYKYGIENFKYEVLFYMKPCNYDRLKVILDSLEKYYIRKYKTLITQHGYNILTGGRSAYIKKKTVKKEPWNKGLKNPYNKETLQKMSEKRKGKSPWNKGIKNCYTEKQLEFFRQCLAKGKQKSIEACQKPVNVYKNNILYGEYKSIIQCVQCMNGIMSKTSIKRMLKGKVLKNFPEWKIIYKDKNE